MGPKAQRKSPNRSKSPKKGETLDMGFVTTLLSDDQWQAIVAFIIPSKAYDELYIEQLEKAAKVGRRRRFTWISKKDLIDQVTTEAEPDIPDKKTAKNVHLSHGNIKSSMRPSSHSSRMSRLESISYKDLRPLSVMTECEDSGDTFHAQPINVQSKLTRVLEKRQVGGKKLSSVTENVGGKGAAAAAKKSAQNVDRMTPGLLGQIEAAKLFIDNKEEIPENVLAKILKAKLLHIRTVEIEKKAAVATAVDRKSNVKKDAAAGGKKTPVKGKKAAVGTLPEIDKQSQLKKKEDIEEEEKYIDDEPVDGPDHYFIISGFNNPSVFTNAEELHLHIDCILKFKSRNYQKIKEFYKEIDDREKQETNLKANLKVAVTEEANKDKKIDVEALSDERRAQMQKTAAELDKFWKDINLILESSQDKSLLQNIARLKYCIEKDPPLKSWFEIEARTDFSSNMFNNIAEKMYELVVQKRQYKNYLANLKLFNVPPSLPSYSVSNTSPAIQATGQFNQPAGQSDDQAGEQGATGAAEIDKSSLYDIRYYNELMDAIPPEYISTPLILHCMVEQVVANEERTNPSNDTKSNSTTPKLHTISPEISQHFSDLIMNLPLSQREKENIMQYFPTQKQEVKSTSPSLPYIINYHDGIGVRLKTVTGTLNESTGKFIEDKIEKKFPFDPLKTEYKQLEKSPFTVITGLPEVNLNLSRERAARLQELVHFCTSPEVTYADADRAFKQFIFESMNLTETDGKDNIILNDEYMVIPWDDPYPNINSTLSAEKQLEIKTLNLMDLRTMSPVNKRKHAGASSAGTNSVKSIKFQDEANQNGDNKDSWGPASILKSRPSTKLSDGNDDILECESVQSVHFDDVNGAANRLDVEPTRSIEQVLEMIRASKQRNLNEWCFAEHFEPKILVQVLEEALYTRPFINTYYNKRDHSLMVVLSNPYNEKSLCNNQEFSVKLHSNVGFRNYLERIYDMIVEWTRDEEAKYQALLTSKEVQSFLSEVQQPTENRSRPTSKSSKKDERSQSQSDKSKKKKDETPAASDEPYITDNFVANDSLKAWKKEHDKQLTEIAQKKPKSPKSKSPSDTKKDSGKAKSRSRSPKSSRSVSPKQRSPSREQSPRNKKLSRSNSKTRSEEVNEAVPPPPPKKDFSFIGYDVGNNMIYVNTHLNHMFPCDGSLIKTEKLEFKTGSRTLVTTSVIKDGNVFSVHLTNPRVENAEILKQNDEEYRDAHAVHGTIKTAKDAVALLEEHKQHPHQSKSISASGKKDSQESQNLKQNENKTLNDQTNDLLNANYAAKVEDNPNPSIAKYGCFTGSFKDGLQLSYSAYDIKPAIKIDSAVQVISALQQEQQQTAAAAATADDKTAKKTADKKKGKKEPTPEPVEIKEPPKYKVLPWSQLYLSTPTGLSCTFIPETYSGVPATSNNEPHRLLVKQYYSAKCRVQSAETLPNTNLNMYKEKNRIIKSDGTVIKLLNDDSIEILYANGTIYRKEVDPKTQPLEDNVDIEAPVKEKSKTGKKKDQARSEEVITPRIDKPKPKWTLITPSGNKYNYKPDKTYEMLGYNRSIVAHDPQTEETLITREDGIRTVQRPDGSSVVDFADGTRITSFYVQHTLRVNDSETGETFSEKRMKVTKYVKIECYGFATTIFNTETSESTLIFGNGTYVSCNPEKCSYLVSHHKGDKIDIDSKGVITYSSRLNTDSANTQSNKFFFYQNADVILDHVDDDGNIFKVDKSGKATTLPVDRSHSSLSSESALEYDNHAPRFFIIHKDSSGTELLRFQDIQDYMKDADIDPMAAIMRDGVQGYPNIMGTTVLRPLKDSINENWARDYEEKEITPIGLRCRNLSNFPSNPDVKVPGAKFGTRLGKSLQIETNQNEHLKNPPIIIPKRMEYRQIIEYERISDELRGALAEGLKNYILYVCDRAEKHRMLLAHDPRSEAERLTAIKVLQLARQEHLFDQDVVTLYRKGIGAYVDKDKEAILKSAKKAFPKPKSNANEKLKMELEKEKRNKQAWKDAFVPSYFESAWGRAFLEREKEKQAEKNETENLASIEQQVAKNDGKKEERYIGKNYDEPRFVSRQALPPIKNKAQIDKSDEALRQSFTYYAPKDVERLDEIKVPNSIKTTRPNAVPNVEFWTIEDPVRRKQKNSIIKASNINGKSLDRRRGCEIYPNQISFGILRENCTYAFDLELINVGIDSCRFKIKQFPPESGLSINYKPGAIAPGMTKDITVILYAIFKSPNDVVEQLAPGTVQLKYELEITTETDTLLIPIEAEIASFDEYHKMFRGNLEAGKNPMTRILTVRTNSSQGVVNKFINATKTS